MTKRGPGRVKGGAKPRGDVRSAVLDKPGDDLEPRPTRIQRARPPSRSLLEGDEAGAPTSVKRVVPRRRADPNDDLTRVKLPSLIVRDLDDGDLAPTKVRRVAHVTGGSVPPPGLLPDPCAPDDEDDDELPPDSEPPPRPDAPESVQGLVIGRRCQLGPAFGRGGMATVHLGRWYGAGGFKKTVAVKRLHRHFATDPDFVKMLLDEAAVVARIRHGNVTSVIDVIEEDDELFIVMDYVHGVTLAHLLRQMKRQKEKMPLPIAVRIASGILHGLQAAHEATDEHGEPLTVIHRDVSPENVIVGTDGYAQLIDFGIARAFGRSTKSADGKFNGKLHYSSPEQLRGESLDAASDIYAASNVLWEMVCGRRLYRGDNAGALVYEVLNGEVPRPSTRREGLSEAFDEIVLRGLNPDRLSRWLAAADMAEALERAVPKASHREVGDWVKAVAQQKLAALTDTLQAVENLPAIADEVAAPPSLSPPSVSSPPPASASVPAPAPAASEPVSVAPPPKGFTRPALIGAAVTVAFAAVLVSVLGDEPAKTDATASPAQPPAPVQTVFVPVPVPAPVPAPAASAAPSEDEGPPAPEVSATAAPAQPARPSTYRPRPKPKPKQWIPDDI